MAKKILLLTEEQKHDQQSFFENVGPDYEYTDAIDRADLIVVSGFDARMKYDQQIQIAGNMKKPVYFVKSLEQAPGKIRNLNDTAGRRNMEFGYTIGYER